jgi:hypothetical protein
LGKSCNLRVNFDKNRFNRHGLRINHRPTKCIAELGTYTTFVPRISSPYIRTGSTLNCVKI